MNCEEQTVKFSEPDAEGYRTSEVLTVETEMGTVAYTIMDGGLLSFKSPESKQTLKNGTFAEGDEIKVWSESGTIKQGELRMIRFVNEYNPGDGIRALVKFPKNKGNVKVEFSDIYPATMTDAEITAKHNPDEIVKRTVNKYSDEQIEMAVRHVASRLADDPGFPQAPWRIAMNFDKGSELLVKAALRRMEKAGFVEQVPRRGYRLTEKGVNKLQGAAKQ